MRFWGGVYAYRPRALRLKALRHLPQQWDSRPQTVEKGWLCVCVLPLVLCLALGSG